MNGKWWSIVVLVAVASLLLGVNSCGRSQELVSIQVQPCSRRHLALRIFPCRQMRGAQVQLRALGTYIHPPVTKDITSQVTWSSNTPQMITVDSSWFADRNRRITCGGTLVSATVNTSKSAGGLSSSGSGRYRVYDGECGLLYGVRQWRQRVARF